jgi:hypothetical protein
MAHASSTGVSEYSDTTGSALRASRADGRAHAVPLPIDSSDPQDSRAFRPASPLQMGTKAPEQPDSLLHPDRPSLLPHPLMLEVANIHGTLKPEFQEYEVLLPLECGSLNPEWRSLRNTLSAAAKPMYAGLYQRPVELLQRLHRDVALGHHEPVPAGQ